MNKKQLFNEISVARQRDYFEPRLLSGKAGHGQYPTARPGEGVCNYQRAEQGTRGKLALFQNLPSGQHGVEKRFEMNVFTHHGSATWLLSLREHVPGARNLCGSPGEIWSLGQP